MRPVILAFSLIVLFTVTTAHAATRTWTGNGADNHFSTPQNWAEGIVPDTGDDLVFPAVANQYSLFDDILPDRILHSVTFQGGNYSCIGASKTQAMTVSAGTQDLGTVLWTLLGPLFVDNGASVTLMVFGRDSNFAIDGPGVANITIRGSSGGVITKQGTGTSTVRLETNNVNSITVNSGRLIVSGGTGTSGPFTVNGGTLEGTGLNTTSLRVTGSGSELKGAANFAGSLEISNGGKFLPTRCENAVAQVNKTPMLTGSVLDLQYVAACDGLIPFINNLATGPVIGNFVNYPEGAVVTIGGRQFRITYDSGDGNDVQFLAVPGAMFDFDGDRRADISVTRREIGGAYYWYQMLGPNYTVSQIQFGRAFDVVTPADYDGDGKTDLSIFRPSTGDWWWQSSLDGNVHSIHWGSDFDTPMPGDVNGDGKADFVVCRRNTIDLWIRLVNGQSQTTVFGIFEDKPLLGDFDGDGKADLAVFRPSTATFWYAASSTGGSQRGVRWGRDFDTPVPADYDGDGTTDIAVYSPFENNWYIVNSRDQSQTILHFGASGDRPIPADYDGDGLADIAVFRPSEGNWYILRSTSGFLGVHWGASGDIPSPGGLYSVAAFLVSFK